MRLLQNTFWIQLGRELALGLQAFQARMAAEPEVVYAEILADARELEQRIRRFKDEHGRRPRKSERRLIMEGLR
jgi:hypothetical protein